MIKEIKEIAGLQQLYSSENTPEMKRRGVVIRKELPDALKRHWSDYTNAIVKYSRDLKVEGSDGIGRKTQAPWVRIFSKELSPSATTGFYFVIHFSTDGTSCFTTLGCGASRWDSDKNDLVKYSDGEIQSKVDWGLSVLNKAKLDLTHFSDAIDIGSDNDLPKSFEKATILCRRHEISTISESDLSNTICKALSLLSTIYDRCGELGDLAQSDSAKTAIETAVNPSKKNINSRQGYGLTAPERKAVELRAMKVTHDYLSKLGYKLRDTSSNNPFDYLAVLGDKSVKVEVKGTTSNMVDSVMMTANEVMLHTNESGVTALAIVSEIEFVERGENACCENGTLEYLDSWNINDWSLVPTSYLVVRPK